ncbi:unnamed protein product [Kluyveromyces dobzhanskii CBS 2104]|uniref:WGS project CCBQ000000000 data, contig 00102 n=1 Tax=Kluyveromyces dobzhanskii CBS 2104 TaxID=1427455 RepID=A0A0A8L6M3_9SACH|nr:unnamed protein product [Kluyveromyces dobzhanskii CBS 2104]
MIVYQDLQPKYQHQHQNQHQHQHQHKHKQLLQAAVAGAVSSGSGSGSGGVPSNTNTSAPASASTIQLSRKWILPPKVKASSRKLSTGAALSRPPSPGRDSSADESAQYLSSQTPNYADKRRKQNREAQRAYRERKANKLHDLQRSIDSWKDKCEALQQDASLWKSRYESSTLENKNSALAYEARLTWYVQENSNLKDTIRKLQEAASKSALASASTSAAAAATQQQELPQQTTMEIQFDSSGKPSCSICIDGSCICEELNGSNQAGAHTHSHSGTHSSSPSPALYPQLLHLKYSFQDPVLQHTLDHWKPMKPVTIESSKKRTNESPKLPQFKRLKSDSHLPLNLDSDFSSFTATSSTSSSTTNVAASSAASCAARTNTPLDENCGFCSETSTCVCREAQEEANRSACTQEPGSCSLCQNDATSKKFCENVVNLARSNSSSSSSTDEYIPINDAFQRIKKQMRNPVNFSTTNIKYNDLAIKGRKVQLKSVLDIIHDMNKNFI